MHELGKTGQSLNDNEGKKLTNNGNAGPDDERYRAEKIERPRNPKKTSDPGTTIMKGIYPYRHDRW